MGWTDAPTPKQISVLRYMIGDLYQQFTAEEVDPILKQVKTRKEASEFLNDVKKALNEQNYHRDPERNAGPWFQKLLDAAAPRLNEKKVKNLQNMLEQHPNSILAQRWQDEIKRLERR